MRQASRLAVPRADALLAGEIAIVEPLARFGDQVGVDDGGIEFGSVFVEDADLI